MIDPPWFSREVFRGHPSRGRAHPRPLSISGDFMNHKAQRLRITEAGWGGYTGPLGGVPFTNGLSDELVDAQTAFRLGSILRVELCDDGVQAGAAGELLRLHNTAMEVKAELPLQMDAAPTPESTTKTPAYTREHLEKIADKDGIAGLRKIADPKGIKGRGIAELISEILADQAEQAT